MEKLYKLANLYVASLRAIYLIHQHNHWTTKGVNFYGNHLLFERIYNGVIGDADEAAEKMIGVFGENGVDFDSQNEYISKVLSKYASLDGNPVKMSLSVEKDFLKLSVDFYQFLEEEGVKTLGVDDMIMSIANKHEGNCYLLQQSLDSK